MSSRIGLAAGNDLPECMNSREGVRDRKKPPRSPCIVSIYEPVASIRIETKHMIKKG